MGTRKNALKDDILMQELENLARLPRNPPPKKNRQSPKLIVFLQIVVQMYLSVPMQRELSLICHRNNVYEHFEQVCLTKWVNWKWK